MTSMRKRTPTADVGFLEMVRVFYYSTYAQNCKVIKTDYSCGAESHEINSVHFGIGARNQSWGLHFRGPGESNAMLFVYAPYKLRLTL